MYIPPTNTQLEAAAREYCRLSNIDAESPVRLQNPIPGANGPITALPRWKFIANSIADQARLNEAMHVAGIVNESTNLVNWLKDVSVVNNGVSTTIGAMWNNAETAQMIGNLEDLEARRPIKVE